MDIIKLIVIYSMYLILFKEQDHCIRNGEGVTTTTYVFLKVLNAID